MDNLSIKEGDIMLLEDFIKTKVEILKSADCVQFLGSDGMEIEYDDYLLYSEVQHYFLKNGILEVYLNVI